MSEPDESLIKGLSELGKGLFELGRAMEQQNELLAQIVAQNADLIAVLVNDDDEEEQEPKFDLAGRPIRS